jgi:flagellar protein FlaG
MDITGVNRSLQAAPAHTAPVPVDHAAQNREVVQAVKALNGTEMFGQDNQLQFQKDQRTGRMVVRVVNRKTNEVISQIPPEYVLRLAQDIKQPKT